MSNQGVYRTGKKDVFNHGGYKKNQTNEVKKQAKTLAESLHFIKKLNDYQLKQLTVHLNGEFHTCDNGKEALDVVNHIKVVFRSKGFGCYALHNYVWIVPFIHQSLRLPDFNKAKGVLPDFKSELMEEAFPGEDFIKPQKSRIDITFNKKTWIIIAIVVFVIIMTF